MFVLIHAILTKKNAALHFNTEISGFFLDNRIFAHAAGCRRQSVNPAHRDSIDIALGLRGICHFGHLRVQYPAVVIIARKKSFPNNSA